MHKLKLLAGTALGAALIWYLLPASTSGASDQNPPQVTTTTTPATLLGEPSAPAELATTTLPLKAQAPVARSASTPSTESANPTLTRALEQVQSVQIAGREWSVLGTNDVVTDFGKQVVLVLRDEISGELDYRQPALRVVLREGVDYESFISALPNAKRLFVNSLYGEIGVDAAQIGAQYAALSSDPRVLRVVFIPLTMPDTAR
jgi:hypothetical protein